MTQPQFQWWVIWIPSSASDPLVRREGWCRPARHHHGELRRVGVGVRVRLVRRWVISADNRLHRSLDLVQRRREAASPSAATADRASATTTVRLISASP